MSAFRAGQKGLDNMFEKPLSYVVLEFFVWNPKWDEYLTKKMEDNQRKYRAVNIWKD